MKAYVEVVELKVADVVTLSGCETTDWPED